RSSCLLYSFLATANDRLVQAIPPPSTRKAVTRAARGPPNRTIKEAINTITARTAFRGALRHNRFARAAWGASALVLMMTPHPAPTTGPAIVCSVHPPRRDGASARHN